MKKPGAGAASNERFYRMKFGTVYPLYVQKVERKGRSKKDLDQVICWLTGYNEKDLATRIVDQSDFEAFFEGAPSFNRNASKITGSICGYRVEEIEDRVVQKVRYLDKLVDELAKGRPMAKILRS